jgi:HAD superfamily hydrolase (TIGR01509 family)
MDGVLVDTEPIYTDINHRLLKRLGVELPLEQLLTYVGLSARRIWSEIRRDFGLRQSVEDLIQLERHELDRELVALTEIPVVPGVITLIETLIDLTLQLGVGSSSPKWLIDRILAKTKLRPYFNAVVSAEEVTHGKPAPDIFIAVSERLGCVPACCTVVEDSPHGIRAARLAGMRAIGFQHIHSGNPDLSGANLIVTDFSKLSIEKVVTLATAP